MATATEPRTEPIPAGTGALDTGPQRVLELAEQGMTTREISRMLPISRTTVNRRIKEAIAARKGRHRAILINAMMVYLTLLATIVTAAWATMAWH